MSNSIVQFIILQNDPNGPINFRITLDFSSFSRLLKSWLISIFFLLLFVAVVVSFLFNTLPAKPQNITFEKPEPHSLEHQISTIFVWLAVRRSPFAVLLNSKFEQCADSINGFSTVGCIANAQLILHFFFFHFYSSFCETRHWLASNSNYSVALSMSGQP